MKAAPYIAGAILGAIITVSVMSIQAYEMRQDLPKFQKNSALKSMKQSAAWTAMNTQLDQYDAHHTDATNKIAAVSDGPTRQALTKSLAAVDDVRDCVVKLSKCFKDYVAANDNE